MEPPAIRGEEWKRGRRKNRARRGPVIFTEVLRPTEKKL